MGACKVGLLPFLLTPACLVAGFFLGMWGGDRWVDGRKRLGSILWFAGLLCTISGSGGMLFGSPTHFWSAMLTHPWNFDDQSRHARPNYSCPRGDAADAREAEAPAIGTNMCRERDGDTI
jgi:hypothetical protein